MEIEPMRAIGVALDKATLQQTLYSLGIDRTFDSLTRAQKTELLYYQIMTQTSKMQGELGRTMATPANMARIMKQEFTQLGRAIGSIFIPIAMKIIPVVRAVVQILTEAAKAIASFFGFKIGNYTSEYSAGLEDISVGLDDIEDSATGAAKAMNKMLMPFDELNNINFSSGSGGGSGIGGVGGGGSLLDTLPEYNIFDSIVGNIDKDVERIKAKIESMLPVLKVLGGAFATAFAFTKLAQFVEWIQRVERALSALGLAGGLIEMGLGLLLTIGGIWAQWQGTKKLLNGDYSIWAVLETIGGTALGAFGIVSILKGIQKFGGLKELSTGNMVGIGISVMLAIQSLQVIADAIKNQDVGKMFLGTLEGVLSVVGIAASFGLKGKSLKIVGINAILGITGLELLISSVVTDNLLERLLGSLSIGALTFTLTGGNFVLATIATGLVFSITSAVAEFSGDIANWWSEHFGEGEFDISNGEEFSGDYSFFGKHVERAVEKYNELIKSGEILNNEFAKTHPFIMSLMGAYDAYSESTKNLRTYIDELTKSYQDNKKTLLENKDATLLSIEASSGYVNELEELIDSEGKVKLGSEQRASFILNELNKALGTEYALNGNLITRNGEVVKSYSELQDEVEKTIEAKKKEIEQEVHLDLLEKALETKVTAQKQYSNALEEQRKLQAKLIEAQNNQDKEAIKKLTQELYESGIKVEEFGELTRQSAEDTAYYSLLAFDNISSDMLDMSDTNSQALGTLFTTNETKWHELYDKLDDTQKQTMQSMTDSALKTVDNISTTVSKSDLPKEAETLASKTTNEFDKKLTLRDKMKQKLQDAGGAITFNTGVLTGPLSTLLNSMKSKFDEVDFTTIGKNVVFGIADGINTGTGGTKLRNAAQGLVNRVFSLFKGKSGFDEHSPSKRMRDEIGYFLPLGIAEGIDKGAYAVEDSVQDLINKTRVDMEDFDFYTDSNLISSINGKINAQTAVALNDNTLQNMTNATYEAMSRALIDNNEDYNPQFNVYIGNDKVYSGFGNYQNNESNRYGVKV